MKYGVYQGLTHQIRELVDVVLKDTAILSRHRCYRNICINVCQWGVKRGQSEKTQGMGAVLQDIALTTEITTLIYGIANCAKLNNSGMFLGLLTTSSTNMYQHV